MGGQKQISVTREMSDAYSSGGSILPVMSSQVVVVAGGVFVVVVVIVARFIPSVGNQGGLPCGALSGRRSRGTEA